ncbi:hypothetical protein [Methanoplanus endosymbiosus]|uniref:Dockerin domain-containing protein n=1 Tax=Methanoplanus endosymbiosus TaxID=33865 RepID=A0A9E7THY7_9EURY|nr:hypothetical protein [Methanoplanus endosymbiosus]UUX91543.1 hypothetical protein L6E24_09185 [Methanoplanus endosymbiosus]
MTKLGMRKSGNRLLTGIILTLGIIFLAGIASAATATFEVPEIPYEMDGADAAALPALPCEFTGSVFIGDIPAPSGTIIRAFIGEEEAGRFVVNQAGIYGGEGLFDDRLIVGGDGSATDQEIVFKIWSNDVSETLVYQPGDSRTFDLTVEGIDGDFNTNAFVDIGDVSKVSYMVADKIEPEISADFNGNGEVDIGDASKIAYFFVRKIEFL